MLSHAFQRGSGVRTDVGWLWRPGRVARRMGRRTEARRLAPLVTVDDGVTVRTRRGHVLEVPELEPLGDLGLRLVLDGELVAKAGRMEDFYDVMPSVAIRRKPRRPPLTFAAFDVLWMDGRLTTGLRYELRRRLLEQLDLDGAAATVVPSWPGDDADVLLEACERLDVEGVVLKRLSAGYAPGRRSMAWRKVKCSTWREVHAERRRPTRNRVSPRGGKPCRGP
jgi:bifunctional non-homologous end joining protein LigD